MRRKNFLSVMIAVLISLTSISVQANTTNIADVNEILPSLENIIFRTSTGDLTLTPLLAEAATGDRRDLAYTLVDPRPLGRTVYSRNQAMDSRLNPNLAAAILMYDKVFTTEQIRTSTGLNITDQQVKSAIQLSLWRHALDGPRTFQIQESSIRDGDVRSLATSIITWATTQVNNRPEGTIITNFIQPPSDPRINAQNAEMQMTNNNLIFGPYSISSNVQIRLDVIFPVGFAVNMAGEIIENVGLGETFFLVVPANFGGSAEVNLVGDASEYKLIHSNNRVWLQNNPVPRTVRFNVGTAVGALGGVDISVSDRLTGMPLVNAEVTIRNNASVVTVLRTSNTGRVAYDLPMGEYTIEVTPPWGFSEREPYTFTIDYIGHVNVVNLQLARSEGYMNFFVVDSGTLANVPYAEALVYKGDQAIRRIAFTNGEAPGFQFEPGDYVISVYSTIDNYSISGAIPFSIGAGEINDLVIPLTPNVPVTTLAIGDMMGRNNWVFQLFRGDEFLFSLNNNGTADLSLIPLEEYQIIARTNDNTHVIQMFSFAVPLYDSLVTIPVYLGTETVSFQFVDTVVKEPIPNIIAGLFNQDHRLIEYQVADGQGKVQFNNVILGDIYFVNILGAPPSVSGYSANGNRFVGRTRTFEVQLYSLQEIQTHTSVDTIWRLPNVVWNGPNYVYPTIVVNTRMTNSY